MEQDVVGLFSKAGIMRLFSFWFAGMAICGLSLCIGWAINRFIKPDPSHTPWYDTFGGIYMAGGLAGMIGFTALTLIMIFLDMAVYLWRLAGT